MFGFITHFHHLGYQPTREHIIQILVIENDIEKAKQKLDQLIEEHDRYRNTDAPNDKIAETDNHNLHHARRHIEWATEQPHQKDATIRALEEGANE